jgi:hypothetical protein
MPIDENKNARILTYLVCSANIYKNRNGKQLQIGDWQD